MPFRIFREAHGKLKALVNLLVYAGVTAVLTLSLATVISGQQRELADRLDHNTEVARAGVDTVMCVLLTDPGFRDAHTIERCADLHGYEYTP